MKCAALSSVAMKVNFISFWAHDAYNHNTRVNHTKLHNLLCCLLGQCCILYWVSNSYNMPMKPIKKSNQNLIMCFKKTYSKNNYLLQETYHCTGVGPRVLFLIP